MIIEKNCEEGDREEKSLSGRLLAPRATDEWLNEVPVGILSLALAPHTAMQLVVHYNPRLLCISMPFPLALACSSLRGG